MLDRLKIALASYIFWIFAGALILRLIGIGFGYPFIFHPDEPSVVRSALGMRFDLNPGHFDWPHLYFYLNYFLYMIFGKARVLLEAIGLRTMISAVMPVIWDDTFVFYLISRIFSAFLGALTVFPVYMAARSFFNNKRIALFSALVLALIPYHIQISHYALVDVPMVFFFAWAMYFSSKILLSDKWSNYLWAGVFVGLAASTKYNGALSSLLVVSAHLLRILKTKEYQKVFDLRSVLQLFSAGALSILSFIVGTPFSVLDFRQFIRTDGPTGAFWQFKNVGNTGVITHLRQFYDVLFFRLTENFGYVFFIVFLALFVYLLVKMKFNRPLLLLYAVSFILIYYVSGFKNPRSHYLMISFPMVTLLAGYGLNELFVGLRHLKWKLKETVANLVLFVLFLVPFIFGVLVLVSLVSKDTRNVLYDWIQTNVKTNEIIYYDSTVFDPLLEKLDAFDVKKKPYVVYSSSTIESGIMITENDGKFWDATFEDGSLRPVLKIDAGMRRGPDILVFRK